MAFQRNCLILLTALSISTAATAQQVTAQFSSLGFNAPVSERVDGFRLSLLHGKTDNMRGFDMALLGMSEVNTLNGVSFNLLLGASKVNKRFDGAAFGLYNWHLGQDNGFNFALVNNTHRVKGVNLAAVNLSGSVAGANIGLVNYSDRLTLIDFGAVNYAKSAKFQFGLVNMTDNLQGLQIGLINYAQNGVLPILPLINFKHSF